jgi:peptidoglycan-associated lipoprotein
MKNKTLLSAVVMFTALLAACASTPPPTSKPTEAPKAAEPAKTAPAAPQRSAAELEMEAKMAEEELKRQQLLSEERVYFAFDSNVVDEPSRAIIEAHSIYVVENPDVTLALEGHTDERGTREYNLALGERRAQAVQKLMLAFGVPAQQLKVVSFGEEKLADPGHDESAWRKNRRVELVYQLK